MFIRAKGAWARFKHSICNREYVGSNPTLGLYQFPYDTS